MYTHESYKKKIAKDISFEEQYLVNIIEHPHYHTDDEVIEYCERLASHLKEWAFLESVE